MDVKAYLTVKGGKYYAILTRYENGERKTVWRTTGFSAKKGNKRKAEEAMGKIRREYELTLDVLPADVTFAEYTEKWLKGKEVDTHNIDGIDIVTYEGYESLVNGHIIPYFSEKKVKLQDVTREMLQEYLNQKAVNGRKDGKGGLSSRSLKLHRCVLQQVLEKACQDGLVPLNQGKGLKIPKSTNEIKKFKANYYNLEEIKELFEACEGEMLEPLIKLTVIYGLRRSEVLGLRWSSVDLKNKTLTIEHTRARVKRTIAKDKTKNKSSKHTFGIETKTDEILRKLKAEQEENRKLFGSEYYESDYVFTWPNGKPFSLDYVSKGFSDLLKRHGLRHIRFHDLRHSCASLLLARGCSLKEIQEWMRHADINVTANTYSHISAESEKRMAREMDSILNCVEKGKEGS